MPYECWQNKKTSVREAPRTLTLRAPTSCALPASNALHSELSFSLLLGWQVTWTSDQEAEAWSWQLPPPGSRGDSVSSWFSGPCLPGSSRHVCSSGSVFPFPHLPPKPEPRNFRKDTGCLEPWQTEHYQHSSGLRRCSMLTLLRLPQKAFILQTEFIKLHLLFICMLYVHACSQVHMSQDTWSSEDNLWKHFSFHHVGPGK